MSKKILIIEDEIDIANAFKKQLELSGEYQVDIANGGKEGLDFIEKNKYDLILLDLVMPHVDGMTVLANMKSTPEKYKKAPVITLTNVESEKTEKEVMQYDVKHYIRKSGINPDELLRLVKTTME